MMNYIVPQGRSEEEAFVTIENYFRSFSENGGNALRIWISSPFLEIEDEVAGTYNPVKFARIDRVLALAETYGLRIKFTLQHIRTISSEKVKQPWANSLVLSTNRGGPFNSIKEYIGTPIGKNAYLHRAKALAERYKDNRQIFGWELWNEMDAVDERAWVPFTHELLDSVQRLFPEHMVTQTLGSLHSLDAAARYDTYLAMTQPFVSLHRYIDPGHDWNQYSYVTLPVDQLIEQMMDFTRLQVPDRPIVVNEIGAVEGNHAGPFKLYEVDTAGVLIHDMIFAPFFCGSASNGAMWHWDSYVQRQNLWHHFKRFGDLVRDLDPITEQFVPFTVEDGGVRSYGLEGTTQTIVWCRDSANDWKTELADKQPAQLKQNFKLSLPAGNDSYASTAQIYNPWDGTWAQAPVNNGEVVLPAFLRSAVVLFTKVNQ